MGSVSAWVAIGLTALTMTAACIAYVYALISGVHGRISTLRDWVETHVADAKKELEGQIGTERDERRREHERLEAILEGFRQVGTAVEVMAGSVKHLGERYDDHRKATDRALDEIKYGMRELNAKMPGAPHGRD